MSWIVAIVAIAAVAIAASVVRHALQDHRDAEAQRRDALADIDQPGDPRPIVARADVELRREVLRDRVSGVPVPPASRDSTTPRPDRTPRP